MPFSFATVLLRLLFDNNMWSMTFNVYDSLHIPRNFPEGSKRVETKPTMETHVQSMEIELPCMCREFQPVVSRVFAGTVESSGTRHMLRQGRVRA